MHAMEQMQLKSEAQFKTFAEKLVNNEALREKCHLQAKYIQNKQLDDDVETAKKMRDTTGYIPPLAHALLEKAAEKGHPEARYLLAMDPEASIQLQQWRIQKALGEFHRLQFMQSNTKTILVGRSRAYDSLIEIVNHPMDPKHPDQRDCAIKGTAFYALGCLCAQHLGVPPEEADINRAKEYLKHSRLFNHPHAQALIDYMEQSLAPETHTIPIDQPIEPAQATQSVGETVLISQPAIKPGNSQSQKSFADVTKTVQNDDIKVPAKPIEQPNDKSESKEPAKNQEKQPQEAQNVAPEKVIVDQEPAQREFDIKEDISTQITDLCTLEQDASLSSFKLHHPAKKKIASKPRDKSRTGKVKTEKKAKKEKDKSSKQHETTDTAIREMAVETSASVPLETETSSIVHDGGQSPTVNEQKEMSDQAQKSTKKEKKQKLEEKKRKKLSKDSQAATIEQEKAECIKAYVRISHLIDQYIGKIRAAVIKQHLLEMSENWCTVAATYKGAYNHLLKISDEECICPELLGILLYLQEKNIADAFRSINAGQKEDSITTWYKALILFKAVADDPNRNKDILKMIDKVLKKSIINYPIYKELCMHDDQFDTFINNQADQDDAGKVRALLYSLLFGNKKTLTKETEKAFESAHKNGSIQATIHYAQMYAYGIFVQQSLSKALDIVQESIKADKHTNADRITLIKDLISIALKNKDAVATLRCSYLHFCEESKEKRYENVLEFLGDTEQQVAITIPAKKAEAARLLISSGALTALCDQAENNRMLATKLRDIAFCRIEIYKHKKEQYCDVFKLVEKLGIKQICDFPLSSRTEAQRGQTHPATQASLNHKEVKIDNDSRARCTNNQQTLVSQWHQAIQLFATERESEARDQAILAALTTALNVPLCEYAPVKDLLYADRQFMSWLKAKALTCKQAHILVLKATILFDSLVTGVSRDTLMTELHSMHENKIAEASFCLAQMYTYGIILAQSLPKALEIIQNMNISNKQEPQTIALEQAVQAKTDLIDSIRKQASQAHDDLSEIHSLYLVLIEMIKLNNSQKNKLVLSNFQYIEKQVQHLSGDIQIKAARLLKESGAYRAMLPLIENDKEIAQCVEDCIATRISLGFLPDEFIEARKACVLNHLHESTDK